MTEDELMALFSLRPKSSGLPMNIFLTTKGWSLWPAHIKVQTDRRQWFHTDAVALVGVGPMDVLDGAIGDDELGAIRRYIDLNRDAILLYWHGLSDGVELAENLKKLEER